MKAKKIFILSITIMSILLFLSSTAYSKSDDTSKIDAVLVLDVSGSMTQSDPKGISFEAANMFIDMCSVKGDRVGVVAYNDKTVQQVPLKEIQSIDDKKSLKNIISSLSKGGATDIGLGLKTAVQILDLNRDSGRRPLIVLLSDGKNEIGRSRTKEQSDADKKDAINISTYKGYKIYTIGLNEDGSVDKDELRDIASSTSAKSFITDTPDNLPQILSEIFADNLNLKIVSPGYLSGTGDFQDVKITIPDSNVIEANISLLSKNPVEVKLLDNNGQEKAVPSNSILYSVSNSYSMIKLLNPQKGEWLLKVKGISGDKIKVNLIFNYDLKLAVDLKPNDKFYRGNTVEVDSYLISNGQKIQDQEIYKNMKAYLTVKDLDKKTEQNIDLTYGNGSFKGKFTIGDGQKYEVKAKVDSNSFLRESDAVLINVENRKSTILKIIKDLTVYKGGTKVVDLSKVFKDPDGDPLQYKLSAVSADIARLSVDNNKLIIKAQGKGRASVSVNADDGKGGSTDITFNLSVISIIPYIVIGTLLIFIIVLALVLIPMMRRMKRPLIGQVAIEARDLNTNKVSPPQYRRLDTYRGRVNLYQLLQLLPEYKLEGEKIVFTRGKNDTLIIKNTANCTIERSGRAINASKGCEIKFGDRIVIDMPAAQKSISLEYFN